MITSKRKVLGDCFADLYGMTAPGRLQSPTIGGRVVRFGREPDIGATTITNHALSFIAVKTTMNDNAAKSGIAYELVMGSGRSA